MKKDIRENGKTGVQYAYLIDECIDTDEYNGAFCSDKEKVWLVLSEFLRWTCRGDFAHVDNISESIGDWLRCLPSCCRVEYRDWEIMKIGERWGYCGTERKKNQFISNWWNRCGLLILSAASYLGLNLSDVRPYDENKPIRDQMYNN